MEWKGKWSKVLCVPNSLADPFYVTLALPNTFSSATKVSPPTTQTPPISNFDPADDSLYLSHPTDSPLAPGPLPAAMPVPSPPPLLLPLHRLPILPSLYHYRKWSFPILILSPPSFPGGLVLPPPSPCQDICSP